MIDTTVAGSAANSYATIEEADDYLETTGYTLSGWTALSDNAKERILLIACHVMETFPVKGSSAQEAYYGSTGWPEEYDPQRLKFPRDEDTQPVYGSAAVPTEVKESQCELAYLVVFQDFCKANPHEAVLDEISVSGDFRAKVSGGGGALSVGAPARSVILFKMREYLRRGALV